MKHKVKRHFCGESTRHPWSHYPWDEARKSWLKTQHSKNKDPVPSLHGKQKGKKWKQWQILLSWAPKSLLTVIAAMKLRQLLLGRKARTDLDSILKSRDIILPTKIHLVESMVFSSSHVQMWELDHKKGWAPKNWCFWTLVLEKTLENPLDCKEIKPVNAKGNQHWIFIGRTDAETETPLLWPPDAKSLLTGKDTGKDWRQKEKRAAEDEMVREHHQLSGREFKQTPGNSEGQRSLACCSPWGHKELDTI